MGRPKCNRTWKVGFFTKMCIRSPKHNGPHVSGDGFISYDGCTDGGLYNLSIDLDGPLIDEDEKIPDEQPQKPERRDTDPHTPLSPYR